MCMCESVRSRVPASIRAILDQTWCLCVHVRERACTRVCICQRWRLVGRCCVSIILNFDLEPVVIMFAGRPLILVLLPFAAALRDSWADSLLRGAKLSDSELMDLAGQAQRLSREKLAASAPPGSASCGMCAAKSYSETCPEGWAESANGQCEAPSGYGGFCSHQLVFAGSSVSGKIAAEQSCDVCWPCAS